MYFAILGKNPQISIKELELVQAKEISYPKKGIVIFDTKYSELLPKLGGVIKIGTVVKEKDLQNLLSEVKIIGIQSDKNGKHLKRTAGIKRYKIVDIFHTDREIKNKGKEIINLENGLYGIVEHYQDIELYETIDFAKPGRSMQMGMMPAKLAHIMINIGLATILRKSTQHIDNICIYDPFVGSGTTGFLANHLGYDFVGSDLQTKYAVQNKVRWESTKFYTPNKVFDIFQQDITQSSDITAHIPKKFTKLIVSEGRLGPIVTKTTSLQDIGKFQQQVFQLYRSFLDKIGEMGTITAVFTIPWYTGQDNFLEQKITEYGTTIGLTIHSIPELYMRDGQQVARKILTITSK